MVRQIMHQVSLHSRIFISLMVLLAALSAVQLGRTGYFSPALSWLVNSSRDAGLVLQKLSITGANKTTVADIRQVLDVDMGMPLVAMDLDSLRTRIESLKWVQSVKLRRQFPDTLMIDLIERKPAALWQHQGVVTLVDRMGVSITREKLADYADFLLIVGENAHKNYAEIMSILDSQPALKAKVQSAIYIGNRRWDIVFGTGMRLRLPEIDSTEKGQGRYSAFDPKTAQGAFARFARLEAEYQILSREIAVVDLRGEKLIIQLTPAGKKRMNKNTIYS